MQDSRLKYHRRYYDAYFRDLDGDKPCVACDLPAIRHMFEQTSSNALHVYLHHDE